MKTNGKKELKILMITPMLNLCGGIESYVLNYYQNFDSNIKMDFITHKMNDNYYKDLIESRGGRVFLFDDFLPKNYFAIKRKISKFFKENHDYDIIHCNLPNFGYLYFNVAKKYKIPVRILHSHNANYSDNKVHSFIDYFLTKLSLINANVYFACTEKAGKFLFKNRKFYVVKNAIDLKKFHFDENKRNKIRKELNLEDKFVIGNVGRFSGVKNQVFLINLMSKIKDYNKDAKLILVGDGPLEDELKARVYEENLEDYINFYKPTQKIEEYYDAMDVFVLPSISEGLGYVNIEAQATGLKVVASNGLPVDTKVTENIVFLDLKNDSEEKWIEEILKKSSEKRESKEKEIIKAGFDIKTQSSKLEKLYFDLYEKYSKK